MFLSFDLFLGIGLGVQGIGRVGEGFLFSVVYILVGERDGMLVSC